MGRVVPEYSRDDIRELIFRQYRIVYQLKDDDILIVSIILALLGMGTGLFLAFGLNKPL